MASAWNSDSASGCYTAIQFTFFSPLHNHVFCGRKKLLEVIPEGYALLPRKRFTSFDFSVKMYHTLTHSLRDAILLASAGNSAAMHVCFYLMLWLALSNGQGNMIQLFFSDLGWFSVSRNRCTVLVQKHRVFIIWIFNRFAVSLSYKSFKYQFCNLYRVSLNLRHCPICHDTPE